MTRREQIARIVDGPAFDPMHPLSEPLYEEARQRRQREALAKADQIMAVEGEASREWRHSRADMASYDAATGEQVSFIYLPDDTRIAVGGGGDVAAQVREIVEAHNATLKAPAHDQ